MSTFDDFPAESLLDTLIEQSRTHEHVLRLSARIADLERQLGDAHKECNEMAFALQKALIGSRAKNEPPPVNSDLLNQQVRRDWRTFAADTQVVKWCEEHSLTLPLSKGRLWRWVYDQTPGQVNALPESYGVPRITDGIELWIERSDGSVYFGHIGHFERDERLAHKHDAERDPLMAARTAKGKKKIEKRLQIEEQVLALLSL